MILGLSADLLKTAGSVLGGVASAAGAVLVSRRADRTTHRAETARRVAEASRTSLEGWDRLVERQAEDARALRAELAEMRDEVEECKRREAKLRRALTAMHLRIAQLEGHAPGDLPDDLDL